MAMNVICGVTVTLSFDHQNPFSPSEYLFVPRRGQDIVLPIMRQRDGQLENIIMTQKSGGVEKFSWPLWPLIYVLGSAAQDYTVYYQHNISTVVFMVELHCL